MKTVLTFLPLIWAQLEQKHMLFLTGEVDGEKYPTGSYRVHTDIFNAPVDGVQIAKAAETPYGFYSSTGEDSDSLFQMILSSFVRLEEAGFDYERHIFCHGDLCKALDQMFLRYPDAAELLDVGGVFYMGHMSVPFDINEQGVLRTDFLDGVRKFYCIGQYDGKSTLLSAARAWNFTRSIDDSWFGITFGGRHRHFGGAMNFGMDDIEIFETSNTESTVHGKLREYFMFFMFNLEDRLELEQSYFEAEIRPIASELSEERFYKSLEGDLTNPDQSQIDNHLNPAIQQMFCEDAVESISGRKCSIYHEWRPEYGVGDGEGSDYEDIANSKPKVSFIEEENAMFIESYSHDYHQPHPGYTVPPQGIHGNASSIDLIFKLKNRKFIARAAGVKDWEAIPEDRCDEIIQLFETQALVTLQNSKNGAQHIDKYAQYGCQHEVLTQRDTFGWFWLNSPVKYEFQDGKMTIEPNAFYTDETNTPEDNLDRLGGMLYCRIVGPARFLEWILVDSFRKRNLRFC
ncbi:unnamed protein product [Oikopleura dioica]|uniref:Uncharacterized protein n=1 Tax=Oikopleura dioica TaxID=34765 RepID=E4XKI9_OIKDI|nr:unnamed protein product [Oikopleura dioica]